MSERIRGGYNNALYKSTYTYTLLYNGHTTETSVCHRSTALFLRFDTVDDEETGRTFGP